MSAVVCVTCHRDIAWNGRLWEAEGVGSWCIGESSHRAGLPEGYHAVVVLLSEKERETLNSIRILHTTRGTYGEAIRRQLGLTEQPWGLITRLKEQKEWHFKGPRAMLPIRKGPGPGTDKSKRPRP